MNAKTDLFYYYLELTLNTADVSLNIFEHISYLNFYFSFTLPFCGTE